MRRRRGTARTSAPTVASVRGGSRPERPKPVSDGSQMIILGACLLGVGILATLGVALGSTNETHPVVRYLPWAPIVIGLALLLYALGRVGAGRRAERSARTRPSDALERLDEPLNDSHSEVRGG